MPDLFFAHRPRPAAGADHRLQALRRALAHLGLPAEDGAFDDLLAALALIEAPRHAGFDAPVRAAA